MFSKSLIQVIHASSSSSMLPFLSMLLFLSYRNSHSPKSEIPTFSLPSWWSISYSNSIFTHLPYYLNSPFSTAFLIRRPTLSGVRKVQTLIRRLTQLRVGKVEGTPERPRLCVFRSNKHLYVQVTDDSKIHTLASASTMQKPVSEELDITSGPTVEVAKKVGEIIAKSCLEKGVMKVAIDRGGYPYHRRIEALAEAAREHCLQF